MTPDAALPITALALAALSLAFTASTVIAGLRELAALLLPRPGPLRDDLLVVMPARNEEARIQATLTALLADPSPQLHVLVVDDRSDDGTARIVEDTARTDPRVHLLRLTDDPPAGMFGKPHALAAGIDDARARGALPARVLFLDADVELTRGALGGLVDALAHSGAAALSGVPRLVCTSAAEQLLVPALVTLVTGWSPPRRVHSATDPAAFLNGQLLLVATAALDDVGGWRAAGGTVAEDVALAHLLKARGHTLRLADLRAMASTRMYTGFGDIVRGFGKNATALLGTGAGALGLLAFALSLFPAAALVLAVSSTRPAVEGVVAAAVCTVIALQLTARKRAGAPLWPVAVLPLVYAGVAFVLVRSSLRALFGRPISWRGRSYPPR